MKNVLEFKEKGLNTTYFDFGQDSRGLNIVDGDDLPILLKMKQASEFKALKTNKAKEPFKAVKMNLEVIDSEESHNNVNFIAELLFNWHKDSGVTYPLTIEKEIGTGENKTNVQVLNPAIMGNMLEGRFHFLEA